MVEAVTFDFWNTLVAADTRTTRAARRRRVLAALAGHGHGEVTGAELERAFDAAVAAFDGAWRANRQFTARDGAELVVRKLGRPLDRRAHAAVVDAFVGAGEEVLPPLAANVATVLRALDGAGVRLGIVCDVGMTPSTVLRRYLELHGVLDAFSHWSFSDEVGVYKPAPAIFEHALAGLGRPAPQHSLHVGDLRRTDVAGARAAGMTAVRYRGLHDDAPVEGDPAPEGHHIVGDHLELVGLTGSGG
jgi:putative hydrolase of the HAD superfamily